MIEQRAGSSLRSATAAVTWLALLIVCYCHGRKGSGIDDLRFFLWSTDDNNWGGRDKSYHAQQYQHQHQHQHLQDSLLDGASVHARKLQFLATAVNMTATKGDEEIGEDGGEGSDVHNKDSHGEGGKSAFDKQKLVRDRCYVLKGEEQTRCHPNIFFFGVSKCGTTSMAHWMVNHPQLRWVSRVKSSGELIKPGQEARALQFQTNEEFISKYRYTAPEATEADPVIDYTPHYSILAHVPYLIKTLYGKSAYDGTVKYFVFLREPAARTVSSWQFKYDLEGKNGSSSSERRSLEEAFKEGSRRVNALIECRSRYPSQHEYKIDLKMCRPDAFLEENAYVSHVGKSMYFLQIDRWTRLFGRNNIKVLFLEEVAADPIGALSSVFNFLGMDLLDEAEGKKGLPSREEWESIVERLRNTANSRKKEILDPQVTPEVVQSMRDFFAPHNARLAELLGRSLPDEWSLPPASR